MPDLFTWMLVFIRVSAMLMLFPVFSITNVPVQRSGMAGLGRET